MHLLYYYTDYFYITSVESVRTRNRADIVNATMNVLKNCYIKFHYYISPLRKDFERIKLNV